MRIGGLQKFSLIDYPGRICAILFTQGCNFRCPYCHNPELVEPSLFQECVPEGKIFRFLKKRRGRLDAVVITGGEPTIQSDLIPIVEAIRAMGFLVKVDTNGSHPEVMEGLIGRHLVDYIAMDVKAPLHRYGEIIGTAVDPAPIKRSIDMIVTSGIDHEFRTTVVRSLLDEGDLMEIGASITGGARLVLQRFVPTTVLDDSLATGETYDDETFERLQRLLGKYVTTISVR